MMTAESERSMFTSMEIAILSACSRDDELEVKKQILRLIDQDFDYFGQARANLFAWGYINKTDYALTARGQNLVYTGQLSPGSWI